MTRFKDLLAVILILGAVFTLVVGVGVFTGWWWPGTPSEQQSEALEQVERNLDRILLYDQMRPPTVKVVTVFSVWSVQIKPEYRGDFWYTGSTRTTEVAVEVEAGQEWLNISLDDNETPLPEVWVEGEEVWCGKVAAGVKKEISEATRWHRCTSNWSVKAGDGEELLVKQRPDDVSVKNDGYLLHITPRDTEDVLLAKVPIYAKLKSPFRYSLDRMLRGVDDDKVIERVTTWATGGTGVIVHTGNVLTREAVGRYSDGSLKKRREGLQTAYDSQTLVLTNEHIITPIYDDTQYYYFDGDSIIATYMIIGGQTYIQLNPYGRLIPVKLAGWDEDKDLALLYKSPALPNAPVVQWLPKDETLPQRGETVWIVGHPLGLDDDVIGEGILDETRHVPEPGMVRWGRERYLITVPARGGSSGSTTWVKRDNQVYAIGMLHASWGQVGSTPWVPELPGVRKDVEGSVRIDFQPPSDIDLDLGAVSQERRIFIPAPYHIIISIDDIAAFFVESGIEIDGLADWYDYKGRS